jgi:energy-coupling factor transporter ATP-binding protein EcfA2
MLKVKNLSIKYPNSMEYALSNISFSARLGQIILIAGASGAGKSTLAQALMTLIPKFNPAELKGEIQIQNKQIQTYKRKEFIEICGYVPQYPADFVTTLSVEEEVALVLENLGFEAKDIIRRLNEVFSILEINHLRNKIQTELSSGELQRVALAAAIAPDTPILIFDEPLARIDLKSEILLTELLVKLARSGRMVLVFEHRLEYLLGVADHVILLDSGGIKSQGSPKDIINDLLIIDPPEVSLLKLNKSLTPPISLQEAKILLKLELSSEGKQS